MTCLNPDRVPQLRDDLAWLCDSDVRAIADALAKFFEFDEEGVCEALDEVLALRHCKKGPA